MKKLHYEHFFSDPGSVQKMTCRVCGAECDVQRNVYEAANFAMATSKVNDLYDVFTCPNTGKDWHEKALALTIEIERSPNMRVADLIKLDLEDLLRDNGMIL